MTSSPALSDATDATPATDGGRRRSPGVVIALCFVAIVFDGYDLVVYGAIVPDLLAYTEWGMTPVDTGRVGSLALLGMLFGALSIGYLTDVVGRRKVMLASVAVFSVLMLASALAPSPFWFGTFRFLAGLGLGGVIPTAIALTVEYSRPERRNTNNALMFSGYAVGGIASALAALALLDTVGFRGMLALGALPLVTVVPLLFWLLPESPSYLAAQGRHAEAAELRRTYGLPDPAVAKDGPAPAGDRLATLVRGRWLVATVLFCLAGIAGQTLIYGLSTWLPQLMVVAGYSVDSSLAFLLTVNVGAVVGVVVSSYAADRFGPRPVTVVSFTAAGVALVLMGTGLASLPVMFALVAVVGFGSIGAQILVNGFVATYYPDTSRASALGITLGLGRLGAILAIYGGGVLVAAELGDLVNFAVWALAAALGVAALLAVPRRSTLS
ncbi:aromatic acid/H+ symport family MFS transporter [uncultured Nocardioides sp.]|uniref:MFS transporter n=1 Tax=uncultured Nocardioides sp. TaxID=198441 RepID=UPI002612CC6E|nr:aromatic acid/H+ symport family MFS transporter [uncultured Nocardioides sp.]